MKALPNPKKEQAAQFVAEGRYEYGEIAEKIGIDRVTLHRWRKDEKFAARVARLSLEFSEGAKARAIRRKDYRVNVLADLQNRLMAVIEARAADPSMAELPGGKTGLLVRKPLASGGMLVGEEIAVDTGMIRELRAVQEQAAKELGQLVDKHEQRVIRGIEDLTDDELAAVVGQPSSGADQTSGAEGD